MKNKTLSVKMTSDFNGLMRVWRGNTPLGELNFCNDPMAKLGATGQSITLHISNYRPHRGTSVRVNLGSQSDVWLWNIKKLSKNWGVFGTSKEALMSFFKHLCPNIDPYKGYTLYVWVTPRAPPSGLRSPFFSRTPY